MTTTTNTGNLEKVSQLLAQLYGSDVTVKEVKAAAFDDHFIAGTYNDGSGNTQCLILCDCEFANRAGAALTMFPSGTANQSIEKNDIEEAVLENLGEFLNIAVNLVAESCKEHVVLGDTVKLSDLDKPFELGETSSFKVDIEKYGSGTLTIATVK